MGKLTMSQLASKFSLASSKVSPVSSDKLRTIVAVGVGYVKDEIQSVHAVDTGTMLNSTTSELIGKDTYSIGPTVGYAPYVALGTSRTVARPFHIAAARRLQAAVDKGLFDAEDLGL